MPIIIVGPVTCGVYVEWTLFSVEASDACLLLGVVNYLAS